MNECKIEQLASKEIRSMFFEGDIEQGIDAIRELADGMRDAFDLTLHGVITADEHRNRYENAYNWLVNHYISLSGAAKAIYVIADAIGTPFTNGDAEIVSTRRTSCNG